MQELVKKLMDESNLDEMLAEKVVEIVMAYLQDKLPAPIASQVEKVLGGDGGLDLGDAADALKDLF
jgi:uncharacterized protein (DUF2267 family)